MATPGNPESIGEVRVNINADTTGLRTGFQEARAETERFGQESERAGQKAEVAATKTKGALGQVVGALKNIQKLVRVIAIPALVIASVLRLWDAWDRARRAAEEYRRDVLSGMSSLTQEVLDLRRVNAGLDELTIKRLSLLDREREEVGRIDEAFDNYVNNTNKATLLWRELSSLILGTKSSLADITKETEEARKKVQQRIADLKTEMEISQRRKDNEAELARVERQRVSTLREQERFSAARMSADISRMAQLLDIIRRQRGGRP